MKSRICSTPFFIPASASHQTKVSKTLVRYLVEWCAEEEFSGKTALILHDVAATPVSPELLPPTDSGEIAQVTEDHVGPYRLHDFFLYNAVRLHFGPRKVYTLACLAFVGEYPPAAIRRWLTVFFTRFFSQQFKRSVLPNGPKVGIVALSPRGDWRMPSDAAAALWLAELEHIEIMKDELCCAVRQGRTQEPVRIMYTQTETN